MRAYLLFSLAILCRRNHFRLGKTAAEVAQIFTRMRYVDEYGLFCRLLDLKSKQKLSWHGSRRF